MRDADGKGQDTGSAGTALSGLRRVLAANPSPMTGPGTTTFLLGQGAVTVIDPGPDDPAHLAAILGALAPGEHVAAILVSHPHLDHSALVPALQRATGAPTLGFGPAGSGRSALNDRLAAAGLTGGEGVDAAFVPDRRLANGDVIDTAAGPLTALHTPGHMGAHLAFAWGDVLFSGDHVMGWAPSLVSPPEGDMGAYMASLARLAAHDWRLILPAHGAPIANPAARLAELTAHRLGRETRVLAALAAGHATLPAITAAAYAGTDPALLPAASRNALAHLIDLASRNLVGADPLPLPGARFRLL